MAINNKKCLACRTGFSYCPNCSKSDALAPAWRREFCSENCATLWSTATKYNMQKLTKAEAKEIISALALKPTEQYVACVQRDLGVILAEEPKPKRSKKQPVQEVVLEDIIEEAQCAAVDEDVCAVVLKEYE